MSPLEYELLPCFVWLVACSTQTVGLRGGRLCGRFQLSSGLYAAYYCIFTLALLLLWAKVDLFWFCCSREQPFLFLKCGSFFIRQKVTVIE